ncbi:MAG: STAS-like domain-containing protein [Burkholderiales bacterium]|nr:STAS-like domain-containing protein [Burkholderiales bacterium]
MSQEIPVRVFDIVGGPLCTSSDDGQLVHDRIAPLLRQGKRVALSFAQVDTVISAFLNAAIGQLYGELKEEEIRDRLALRDMAPEDLVLLKRVVENAKAYFKDPKRFTQAVDEEGA